MQKGWLIAHNHTVKMWSLDPGFAASTTLPLVNSTSPRILSWDLSQARASTNLSGKGAQFSLLGGSWDVNKYLQRNNYYVPGV